MSSNTYTVDHELSDTDEHVHYVWDLADGVAHFVDGIEIPLGIFRVSRVSRQGRRANTTRSRHGTSGGTWTSST